MKHFPSEDVAMATVQAPDQDIAEGWVSALMPDVCEINPAKPPANAFAPETPVTFVPMPAVDAEAGAITAPESRSFSKVRKGFTAFREGDVIFAKITPCMENGKAAIARNLLNGLGFGSTEFHVLRSNGAVLPEFIYHFVRQELFRKEAEAEMTGSVGQKRVPADFLRQVNLPLPPLAEQRRIIAKIDELFAQVNFARSHLAKVAYIIERFRQALLAAACSGRLTASWRAENNNGRVPSADLQDQVAPIDEFPEQSELPETWHLSALGELVPGIEAGKNIRCMERPPGKGEKGIVKISSVTWGTFLEDESKTLHHAHDFNPDWRIQSGDLLISRANTIDLVGACVIVKSVSRMLMLSDKVLRLLAPKEWRMWLLLLLRSPHGRYQIENLATGNQLSMRNISQENIRHILVPIPPPKERDEIVRRVEALFAHADAIEKQVEAATKRADKLTQAILAKAFRGELVPTEAELARREARDYEPASAFLARIKARGEMSLKA